MTHRQELVFNSDGMPEIHAVKRQLALPQYLKLLVSIFIVLLSKFLV